MQWCLTRNDIWVYSRNSDVKPYYRKTELLNRFVKNKRALFLLQACSVGVACWCAFSSTRLLSWSTRKNVTAAICSLIFSTRGHIRPFPATKTNNLKRKHILNNKINKGTIFKATGSFCRTKMVGELLSYCLFWAGKVAFSINILKNLANYENTLVESPIVKNIFTVYWIKMARTCKSKKKLMREMLNLNID